MLINAKNILDSRLRGNDLWYHFIRIKAITDTQGLWKST